MVKGYLYNNTGKAKFIFKRSVPAGHKILLEDVYQVVSLPPGESFLEWVQENIPEGWELSISADSVDEIDPTLIKYEDVRPKFVESGQPEKHLLTGDPQDPVLANAPVDSFHKLTSKDIFNLKLKDDPKRVLKNIDSIHKLRRSLALCKGDPRKAMLTEMIRARIAQLMGK